jgi:transcriptional regulator with XRE-family HTH domain
MAQLQLTTGVPVLDRLIDDVRIGDNLVVQADPGLDVQALIDAFVASAPAERLVVAATEDRSAARTPATAALLDWRARDAGVAASIEALGRADDQVGREAVFLIDSLSTLQDRWGADAALEVFLATCPHLYQRGSVALWLLDRERHDRAFLSRLRDITQVVIDLTRDGDEVVAEVLAAAGRPPTTVGRRLRLNLDDRGVRSAGPIEAGRARLGEIVRAQRTTRGLSQAEVARRIGISPSALSQVERGVRGLSAESLIRIWEVLGVPFGPEDTLQRGYRISRRGGHREVTLPPGIEGRQVLDDPTAGRSWQLRVAPGASGRGPLFPGKDAEVVLVLSGVLDLEVGGHPETLQTGDTLVASDAVIGAWGNPATVPVELLWTALR